MGSNSMTDGAAQWFEREMSSLQLIFGECYIVLQQTQSLVFFSIKYIV